jgi:hypothetical protein
MTRYDRFPAGPVEPSHEERQRMANPKVSVVIVDKLGDYQDWARRNPDKDAIPYVVGQRLPNMQFDRLYFAREVHPLIEWVAVELGSRIKDDGGKVSFEKWPAST